MPRRSYRGRDPFEVLGVSRDADDETIKRAYRRLAADLHPDRNPDPLATQQLKEVVAAWEVLSDLDERRDFFDRDSAADDFDDDEDDWQPTGARHRSQPGRQQRRRSSAADAERQQRVEAALFQALFSDLLARDERSASEQLLSWLASSACVLFLVFQLFGGLTDSLMVDAAADGFRTAPAWGGDPAVNRHATNATTAEPWRYWLWIVSGSVCSLWPSMPGLVAMNGIAAVRALLTRRPRWINRDELPEDLLTAIRGCGILLLFVAPHAFPELFG